MKEKLYTILGMLKNHCEKDAFLKAYVYAHDNLYDEWSANEIISSLSFDRKVFDDMDITPDTAKELIEAKAKELNISILISPWNAYVEIAKAIAIHFATFDGDLDTAITLATERINAII